MTPPKVPKVMVRAAGIAPMPVAIATAMHVTYTRVRCKGVAWDRASLASGGAIPRVVRYTLRDPSWVSGMLRVMVTPGCYVT